MRENRTEEPINLDRIENEFFRTAIQRRFVAYHAHFGERLVALYVYGSVHRGEAVPEVSDLDLHHFIADAFGEADQAWYQRLWAEFERESPEWSGLAPPRPLGHLFDGLPPDADAKARDRSRALGIRLRHDATLVWGRDLTAGLNFSPPDREWASRWFQAPWDLIRHAAGLEAENRTDFDLPEELSPRLRKLARIAVLGGAAILILQRRDALIT